MSTSIDNTFITKWQEEINHEFQQTESKLRNTVKVVTGVGSTL